LLELDSLGNVIARNVFGTKLISREVAGKLKGLYRYNGHWPSILSKIGSAISKVSHRISSGISWAYNKVKSGVSWAYNKVKSGISRAVSKTKQYAKAAISTAQRAYNYTKTQMNKAIQAVKKIDVSKLAVGALNLLQGGVAIGVGASLAAVCPPAGFGLMALGMGTALIGFGQSVEGIVHEDPVRKLANSIGISNSTYDMASEAIPFITSLGCAVAL